MDGDRKYLAHLEYERAATIRVLCPDEAAQ
jgi:hypothetical protein